VENLFEAGREEEMEERERRERKVKQRKKRDNNDNKSLIEYFRITTL